MGEYLFLSAGFHAVHVIVELIVFILCFFMNWARNHWAG